MVEEPKIGLATSANKKSNDQITEGSQVDSCPETVRMPNFVGPQIHRMSLSICSAPWLTQVTANNWELTDFITFLNANGHDSYSTGTDKTVHAADERIDNKKTINAITAEEGAGRRWEQLAQATLEIPGLEPIKNPYHGRFWYTLGDKKKWVNEFRKHGKSSEFATNPRLGTDSIQLSVECGITTASSNTSRNGSELSQTHFGNFSKLKDPCGSTSNNACSLLGGIST